MHDELDYYTTQSRMTDPGSRASLFDPLPDDLGALCRIVQGLIIHVFWTSRYGVHMPAQRHDELKLRSVPAKLERMLQLNSRPLVEARPPERRLLGNCRDFTLLLTSMLRHHGRPARARCGFARYFQPEHFEDHWVCEYWDGTRGQWALADAQLDDLQRSKLSIEFDPLDLPRDRFVTAGEAWRLVRAGLADPDSFGVGDLHGAWMVRGNLVRDLAALNKIELLPWDGWGVIETRDEDLTAEDLALLDGVADLTRLDPAADRRPGAAPDFPRVRQLYGESDRLRVPAVIRSYTMAGVEEVPMDPGALLRGDGSG